MKSETDSKDKIEKVATKIFAEKGFDGSSVREIAEKAGLGKPMIYYYFKNKDDLYFKLLETAVSPLCSKIEEVTGTAASPPEKIKGIVGAYQELFWKKPNLFQLVHMAAEKKEKVAGVIAEKYFTRAHLALSDTIQEGIEKKVFKKDNPSMLAFSVIGIILHYLTMGHIIQKVSADRYAPEEFINVLASHIIQLLSVEADGNLP